jgi:flagellar motor switch protein FliG
MSVYESFKKEEDGLRCLVELLEGTPAERQQRMIEVGMQEDPEYTKKALQYILSFEDIVSLSDLELSEVLSHATGKVVGWAVHQMDTRTQMRFLSQVQPRIVSELKESLEDRWVTFTQVHAGKMKLIAIARRLEKQGVISAKRIPEEA